jgi:hypothetical protein
VNNSVEDPFTRWSDLAQQLPGRVGKQVRDRWVNHLNPSINHLPFSKEDDLKLWEGHCALGKRWVEISAKYFKSTRSENHIKVILLLSVTLVYLFEYATHFSVASLRYRIDGTVPHSRNSLPPSLAPMPTGLEMTKAAWEVICQDGLLHKGRMKRHHLPRRVIVMLWLLHVSFMFVLPQAIDELMSIEICVCCIQVFIVSSV